MLLRIRIRVLWVELLVDLDESIDILLFLYVLMMAPSELVVIS